MTTSTTLLQSTVLLPGHREAYRGALTEEELDALDQAAAEKERAMSVLMEREAELQKLREGLVMHSKVRIIYKAQFYGQASICSSAVEGNCSDSR